MVSLSTISYASYNPSNNFIRIINYQIFLNQLKWNHPILATTILSMNGSVHTLKHHSQMEQTHTLKARKER